MEKGRIKKARATVQKQIQKQRQENAENIPVTTKTNTIPIEIPQPFQRHLVTMCIFKRGQTTHIHNLCIKKRRLYWSLSPS
jgi:hypothetical protein